MFLPVICFLASQAFAKDVNYHLDIKNALLAPDGFERSVVAAEGRIPGPLIQGNIGDCFLINVTDCLSDSSMRRSTAVHWHGIFQQHSALMDGVATVTQCPIVPGHSFLYNFSVPNQSGTYWYHSHLSTQYCDGLSGPLVIYDANDPLKHMYDIDDESTVVTLQDWYHSPAPALFPDATASVPTPNSTLINGLGRQSENPTSELAVIRAQLGKRYRFRLINMGCEPSYTFYIEDHDMTIIEVDGTATEPLTVGSLKIFPAQRYSIVVTMNKPVDNYWIRAIPSFGESTTENGVNSAILRYDGAPDEEPCTDFSANPTALNESDLHPLINPGAPGEPYPGGADVVLKLQHSLAQNGSWLINNVTFIPPSIPILLQILGGTTNANGLLPSGSIYNLPRNKTIEIIIPGGGDHPFHLHGHTFDVVRVANSSTYNYANPVRRDTVSIGDVGDEVTIRFVTDNPGPWFLHCHIDWHLAGGLGVVLAEATEDIAQNEPANADWSNLCPLYDKLNPDTHLDAPVI